MQKLTFDTGVQEIAINDTGVLRFNPSDPNLYYRFFEASDKIQDIEAALVADGAALDGVDAQQTARAELELMHRADREVKAVLDGVFGPPNDFDTILGGVNLMAVAQNGERVITNLLHALAPIVQKGAEDMARDRTDAAVAEAKERRARRGADL